MAAPRIVVTIAPHDSAQESSLEQAHARLVDTPGITVRRMPRALKASVDVRRIEAAGPKIEAVAVEFALTVELDDLDAEVPLGRLRDRPSGIWAALGDGWLRTELAIERGEAPAPSTWQFASVTDEGGQRIVRDARPPRATPSLGPMDDDEKFDDIYWHEASAVADDQPPRMRLHPLDVLFTDWAATRSR